MQYKLRMNTADLPEDPQPAFKPSFLPAAIFNISSIRKETIVQHEEIFDYYIAEGIIGEVLSILKTGKEAQVFRCSLGTVPRAKGVLPEGAEVAIKIYKDLARRSFRNMSDYLDGRIGTMFRKRRDILHMYSDPATMQANWVWVEYEALKTLTRAGLYVPHPLGSTSSSVAMEFIGEPGSAGAPRLRDCRLSADEAKAVFATLRDSIRLMLGCDLIHGDLSPFNILYHREQPVIIDLPQVVDARYHSQALSMLERDCVNVYRYFERFGFGDEFDAKIWAGQLWEDYIINRLYA